jgi:SWI/SNF-related matrix-associated actin-dependent regulator of chromatin subfamily A member 5
MEAKYNGFLSGVDPDKIFSPAMQTEKELIESRGFPNWERREYQKFLQALENFATDDYKNISRFMDGSKTQQEVEAYARVFFQKMKTLNDWQKIKAKIEKA